MAKQCEHCHAPIKSDGLTSHGTNCPESLKTQPTSAVSTEVRTSALDLSYGQSGLMLTSLDEALRFANICVESGLAPKGMKAAGVVIAVQAGAELGFSPMRSLANIAAINGRAGPMTKAAKALVLNSGMIEPGTMIKEWVEGDGNDRTGFCSSTRRGWPEKVTHSFSIEQAKQAGLVRGGGAWNSFPDRMLLARARGFHFDDVYPDVLMGMPIADELPDGEIHFSNETAHDVRPRSNVPVRVLPENPTSDDPLFSGAAHDPPAPTEVDPLFGGEPPGDPVAELELEDEPPAVVELDVDDVAPPEMSATSGSRTYLPRPHETVLLEYCNKPIAVPLRGDPDNVSPCSKTPGHEGRCEP